jgi:hypothetical protein
MLFIKNPLLLLMYHSFGQFVINSKMPWSRYVFYFVCGISWWNTHGKCLMQGILEHRASHLVFERW